VRHWHSVERLSAPSLEGAGGWCLVALLGAYFLMTMQNRVALIGSGVDCWPALGVCVVIAFVASGVAVWRLRPARPYLRPVEATATLALAAMVVTDLTMNYQPLRDLGIYLKAGGHYLAGAPVYLQTPMTARPADLTNYPFLYPPLTLPGFAVLVGEADLGGVCKQFADAIEMLWLGKKFSETYELKAIDADDFGNRFPTAMPPPGQ